MSSLTRNSTKISFRATTSLTFLYQWPTVTSAAPYGNKETLTAILMALNILEFAARRKLDVMKRIIFSVILLLCCNVTFASNEQVTAIADIHFNPFADC